MINHTSVPQSPNDNMKAAEDFLLVVLHAHIVAAAENIFKEQTESPRHLPSQQTTTLPQASAQQLDLPPPPS